MASPPARRIMTSEAPASPPMRISASSREAVAFASIIKAIMREGCSLDASMATAIAASEPASSISTTRVNTLPSATAPPCSRMLTSSFEI